MTKREALKRTREILSAAGIADAETDARLLLSHVTGEPRETLAARAEEELPPEEEGRLFELARARADRIPLQHLTGEAWIDGRAFFVNEDVLIPRFDTEVLIEEARKVLAPGARVLDLCTGSGCVLISLLAERSASGTGSDISPKALAVAQKNAQRHGTEAVWIESDLFAAIEGSFDLITANPPYIRRAGIETLDPEVRDHDPVLALDGGDDGLSVIRRIVTEAPAHLAEGGHLLLEIGYDQGEAVRALLEEAGYSDVSIIRDLAGSDRVARAMY